MKLQSLIMRRWGGVQYHPLVILSFALVKWHLNEDCEDSCTIIEHYHYYPLNTEMSSTSCCSDLCSGISWCVCR